MGEEEICDCSHRVNVRRDGGMIDNAMDAKMSGRMGKRGYWGMEYVGSQCILLQKAADGDEVALARGDD